MAYVARGAMDYIQINYIQDLQTWDVTAGIVIIREAGGTVMKTKYKKIRMTKRILCKYYTYLFPRYKL